MDKEMQGRREDRGGQEEDPGQALPEAGGPLLRAYLSCGAPGSQLLQQAGRWPGTCSLDNLLHATEMAHGAPRQCRAWADCPPGQPARSSPEASQGGRRPPCKRTRVMRRGPACQSQSPAASGSCGQARLTALGQPGRSEDHRCWGRRGTMGIVRPGCNSVFLGGSFLCSISSLSFLSTVSYVFVITQWDLKKYLFQHAR